MVRKCLKLSTFYISALLLTDEYKNIDNMYNLEILIISEFYLQIFGIQKYIYTKYKNKQNEEK